MPTTLRFKQPLGQHSDGRVVPAGRATVAGQLPIFIVHTYEREKGIDSSKKTQLENTQDKQKNCLFPSLLILCPSLFPLSLQPTKLGTQCSERKREKLKSCLSKSTTQVHNQPNQVYSYWRAVPLKAVLPARGVWVSLSQHDNKNHCCICLDSPSKSDPPLWSKCSGLSAQ